MTGGTADGATANVASATGTSRNVDADGATAAAASAADTGMDVDTDPVPAVIAPTPPNTDTNASPKKKRRRSRGPGYEADRKVFYASKERKVTDDPENQGGADARGEDRGGA